MNGLYSMYVTNNVLVKLAPQAQTLKVVLAKGWNSRLKENKNKGAVFIYLPASNPRRI